MSTDDALVAIGAHLDAKPGAYVDTLPSARGVGLYKVKTKMFAILNDRVRSVTVKCDPQLVELMKQTYRGAGHRGHLDRRFWLHLQLDADVPLAEVRKLIDHSYDLVCAGLTRKQRADLAARQREPSIGDDA